MNLTISHQTRLPVSAKHVYFSYGALLSFKHISLYLRVKPLLSFSYPSLGIVLRCTEGEVCQGTPKSCKSRWQVISNGCQICRFGVGTAENTAQLGLYLFPQPHNTSRQEKLQTMPLHSLFSLSLSALEFLLAVGKAQTKAFAHVDSDFQTHCSLNQAFVPHLWLLSLTLFGFEFLSGSLTFCPVDFPQIAQSLDDDKRLSPENV